MVVTIAHAIIQEVQGVGWSTSPTRRDSATPFAVPCATQQSATVCLTELLVLDPHHAGCSMDTPTTATTAAGGLTSDELALEQLDSTLSWHSASSRNSPRSHHHHRPHRTPINNKSCNKRRNVCHRYHRSPFQEFTARVWLEIDESHLHAVRAHCRSTFEEEEEKEIFQEKPKNFSRVSDFTSFSLSKYCHY